MGIIQVAARIFISIPPFFFWLGCCPCEKEKLVQPQQMMARVCIFLGLLADWVNV
jgi:hypothetical protein